MPTAAYVIHQPDYPRFPTAQDQNWGPFEYSGRLFYVGADNQNTHALTGVLRIYSSLSTDQTVWVDDDGTNAPATFSNVSVYYPGSGAVLYIALSNRGGDQLAELRTFDMGTRTWSSAISGGPDAKRNYFLTRFTDGRWYLFYGKNGTPRLAHWARYDEGVGWTSIDNVVSDNLGGSDVQGGQMLRDENDDLHLFWGKSVFVGATPWYHRILTTSTDTLTAAAAFQDNVAAPLIPLGHPIVWGSQLVMTVGIANGTPKVVFGTPQNAPVWTPELASTDIHVLDRYLMDFNGNLRLLYIQILGGSLDRLVYVDRVAGTWGTPVVHYDVLDAAYVATPGPIFSLHNVTASKLTSGAMSVVAAAEYTDPGDLFEYSASYAMVNPSGSTPPIIYANFTDGGFSSAGIPFNFTY